MSRRTAQAALAYDAAEAATRFARAKGAHDELIAAAHRAQADALRIEAQAKCRLAQEYDEAQEREEVRSNGQREKAVPDENSFLGATVTDLGLTRKAVHEARQIRNAEALSPGVVARTLAGRRGADEGGRARGGSVREDGDQGEGTREHEGAGDKRRGGERLPSGHRVMSSVRPWSVGRH